MDFKEACSVVADIYEAIPETWTAGSLARNKRGDGVLVMSPKAVSWCAVGAVGAAMGEMKGDIWQKLDPYGRRLGFHSAVGANNVGGREVAIKMLRMASGELSR